MVFAMRALLFPWVLNVVIVTSVVGAGGCGSGKKFLEGSEGLCVEFDEFIQFLVILMSYGIDKFSGCFENKVCGLINERISGLVVAKP